MFPKTVPPSFTSKMGKVNTGTDLVGWTCYTLLQEVSRRLTDSYRVNGPNTTPFPQAHKETTSISQFYLFLKIMRELYRSKKLYLS